MRIFLTGGTGYIGGALARRLVAEGHQVRALVRSSSDRSALEAAGAVCYEGDLIDRASMREGMSGADWVIHAAAELEFDAPREQMHRTNVIGSENVASLAWKLGVGRVLALSSIAAFGGSPGDGTPATESSPPQRPFPSTYSETKHLGEQAFHGWAEKGLKLNVVYPSLVYGPPGKRGGVNGLLRQYLKGRIPFLVGASRWTTWIYLDDLVEGVMRVLEHAPVGENYLLAGERTTVGQLASRVCRLGNVAPPRWRVPTTLAKFLAAVAGPVMRARKQRLALTTAHIDSLRRHWGFDDAKAREAFAWSPRELATGLPPTVDYLLREGTNSDVGAR